MDNTILIAAGAAIFYKLGSYASYIFIKIKNSLIRSYDYISTGSQFDSIIVSKSIFSYIRDKYPNTIKKTSMVGNNEQLGSDIFYITYKNKYLIFNVTNTLDQHGNYNTTITISAYRDLNVIKDFIQDSIKYYDSLCSATPDILDYKIVNSNVHYLSCRVKYTTDDLVFDNKKELVDDVKYFISRNDFRPLESLKRCYLLYGAPGNGKSSFIKAIANMYKSQYDLVYISFDQLVADKIISSFSSLSNYSSKKIILVLEDFDRVLRNPDNKLSLQTVLNMLDGYLSTDNLIIFITMNNKEGLDPALLRPGRIDVSFEFKNPTLELAKEYCRNLIGEDMEFEYEDESYASLKIKLLELNDKRRISKE